MQYIIALVLLALACMIRIAPPGGYRIVDGDTVERRGRRIRLHGYDAPEWDQPHGAEARRALADKLGAAWSLAIVIGVDRHGRRLAWMTTSRGPIATRMIGGGHGHADDVFGLPVQIVSRLLRRGLWGRTGAKHHPADWRASRPRGLRARGARS